MAKQKNVGEGDIISGANDVALGMKFINPEAIIDTLEIKAGMLAADFGCGTGYFSFPLAKKVGSSGRVYALDILKEKLEAIESEAKVLGLNNITVKRANLEMLGGSKLDADSLDWVCLVNMLFQNKNKKLVLEEAIRVLKKAGKILIVEWNDNEAFGPDKKSRIAQNEISDLALNLNLSLVREVAVSHFHYGIIFEK